MDEKVIPFTGFTTLSEPCESLLEKAKLWGMEKCLVIGIDEEGALLFGGSFWNEGESILMLERAKKIIVDNNTATN